VAVALAAGRPLRGIVLVTPFDSLAAVAKRHYPYLPVDWMLKHRFDSIALAPRRRLLFPEAGHGDIEGLPAYWPEIRRSLREGPREAAA
jgi:hypothetical protein